MNDSHAPDQSVSASLAPESFVPRHIGPREPDVESMLQSLGFRSLDELSDAAVPAAIRSKKLSAPSLGEGESEAQVLREFEELMSRNEIWRSYLGMGFSDCITPPAILRNLLEDPRWYTPYTPYQAEISQGRLEALLNFQTMVTDLTGLAIANASLLDEGTAAAEALSMCYHATGRPAFFVAEDCHPTTIEVVKSRAEPIGIRVTVGDPRSIDFTTPLAGILLQYPATDGVIHDYRDLTREAHDRGALVVAAADILALALIRPPGEWGADIAVGNTQRFGVPLGYGGPHAAYLATRNELKRQIPGRIVGVSRDADGRPGLRLALQTREQHIRRFMATAPTSNICTAQVLLAVTAGMYAVYHGPEGIRRIATRIHAMTVLLSAGLKQGGFVLGDSPFFDTLRVTLPPSRLDEVLARARRARMNLRRLNGETLTISLDETTTLQDVRELLSVFGVDGALKSESYDRQNYSSYGERFERTSPYLTHPVFHRYHSETELMRYLNRLQAKDLSLAESMIPLGSCTMKLNAAAEMIPLTWAHVNRIHPFVPREQAQGYAGMIARLETMLGEITGFPAVSLQPNAGSQGEYAGLLVIRAYHRERGEGHRNVCLIPQSAHGTNPATAGMAGMKVVVVKCDAGGNIDVEHLRSCAQEHSGDLAALMVTYPSTHGVFEEEIREICDIVHRRGGQVYMDGANMNAQVGICRPGDFGADVLHLNLHKTFCIPHGGGGPGMGPIGVAKHLAPYLPGHSIVSTGGDRAIGEIATAPWGSASILHISYIYIRLMGAAGLRRATQVAILNANYVARRLDPHFPVLYRGKNGLVAHECIVDLRQLKETSGVEVEDVAKRLIDYGFHAPTVSFPVGGTLMIEPTESESLEELDRFCDALISIRQEISEIEEGRADPKDNLLKNAPHPAESIASDDWKHPYSRQRAAFPVGWLRERKYWCPVSRIDNVYGERNLFCSCVPLAGSDL